MNTTHRQQGMSNNSTSAFMDDVRVAFATLAHMTVFLLLLVKGGGMDAATALKHLTRLAPFVSDDEFTIVKMKLDELQRGGA